MGTQRADFEPFAWCSPEDVLGRIFETTYTAYRELPSQILTLVERLGAAVEGDQFREESSPDAPSLLSKLDAVEGSQLLRASRRRLRALRRLRRSGSSA